MAGFFRKLFHLGVVPDALRAQLAPEGILAEFSNVGVRYTFSGHVPGLVSALDIRGYAGSLVFTAVRVAGTLSLFPNTASRAVDVPWTTGDDGAVQVTIDPTGLHVEIDLQKVDPGFSGTQSLFYKQPLSAELLAKLPKKSFGFDIPREFAMRLAGVPVRKPKNPSGTN